MRTQVHQILTGNYRIHLAGILLLLLLNMAAFSQSTWTVQGTVQDQITDEPLAGAQVIQQGAEKGILTDAEGFFRMEVTGESPVLVVSYLGYTPLLARASRQAMTLRMEPSGINLETVEITDNRVELAYPVRETHITDFTFLNGHLLMIVHDPKIRKAKLILIDDRDSIIAEHKGVGEPPKSFYRDCLGNTHVLSENFASQIHFEENELLLTKDPIESFRQTVIPCSGVLNNTYFLHWRLNDQMEGYEWRDPVRDAKGELYRVVDTFALAQMRDDSLMSSKNLDMVTGGKGQGNARGNFLAAIDQQYKKHVSYKKTYAPLFIIRGKAYVFDHEAGKILRFDHFGKNLDESAISYPKQRNWVEQVIVDLEEQNAYTLFESSGFYTLKRIDLETGGFTGEWQLEKQFISRVTVRDQTVYFLYREKNYDPVKRLYRLKL